MPPDPVLRAAERWLKHLPPSSPARCRALFTSHRDFSDLTPTQYEAAFTWLVDTGLLDEKDSPLPSAERIYSAAISHANPHWLNDADDLVRSPDELPEDAARAADALGLTRSAAFAHVLMTWGKNDTSERVRVGAAGEAALVRMLRDCVRADVDHVAAVSDGYGYDIAVGAEGFALHIEVKATSRRSRLKVYLSRNEYETMCRDPYWQMVAVRLRSDDEIAAVGTVSRNWIAAEVPADRGGHGRWETCRFDVPPEALLPGIPSLRHVPTRQVPPALQGDLHWPGSP